MRGKKAMSVGDFMYWVVRIMFLLLILTSIYFLTRIYEQREIDTADIEAGIFKHYLIYSPNALSYRDPYIDRVYPGIVEVANFNSARLEGAANFSKAFDMVAANISLYDLNGTFVVQAYYNQRRFIDWLPLTHPSFMAVDIGLNRGTVLRAVNETYVIYVNQDGSRGKGMLKTDIMVPRS